MRCNWPVAVLAASSIIALGASAKIEPNFTLLERAATDSVAVHAGPDKDNAGDVMTFANPLFDVTNKSQLGGDEGFCIRIKPSVSWHCHFTVFVRDGSITVDGPDEDAADTILSVVAGTGKFADAAGTMRLHARDKSGSTYEFGFSFKQH